MGKFQHIRSATPDKRPDPALLVDGQLSINTAATTPGVFTKDDAGGLIKVGPTHIGTTAPNSAGAGSVGNSVGEHWMDTSVDPPLLKVWDGSAWLVSQGLTGATGPQGPAGADSTVPGPAGETGPQGDSLFTKNEASGNIVPLDPKSQLRVNGGTAASPGYGPIDGIGTGLSFPSPTELLLSTEGVGRLGVNSSGGWDLGGSGSHDGTVLTGKGWNVPPVFEPLPAGATGPAGPAGPAGEAGPAGPAGADASGVPYGTITMFWGHEAPVGWNFCDGTNGTPLLQNYFPIVAGNIFALGASGGSHNSTLPYHGHGAIVNATQNVSWSGANMYGGGMGYAINNVAQSQGNIGVSIDPVGSDPSWTNMPMFIAIHFIMKINTRVVTRTVNGKEEEVIENIPFDSPIKIHKWVPPASDWVPDEVIVPEFVPNPETVVPDSDISEQPPTPKPTIANLFEAMGINRDELKAFLDLPVD